MKQFNKNTIRKLNCFWFVVKCIKVTLNLKQNLSYLWYLVKMSYTK